MNRTEGWLSPDLLERLADKVQAKLGLFFPGTKQRELRFGLRRMTEEMRLEQDEACVDWLLSEPWDKSKADLCARHLTIGETYFFREPRAFDLLCDYARKKLNSPDMATTMLRIWSAGCCTGEEPYSIAMALRYSVPELEPHRISILGTDLNAANLRVAQEGFYRQWSIRSHHAALRNPYVVEEGENQFRVSQQIRDLVRFSELNLASPVYPSATTGTTAIDIIFCRNVLMYFSREQATQVIERFRQCLVDGGWLIVSPSEASSEMFAGFTGYYFPDAIYFQKKQDADGTASPQSRSSFDAYVVPTPQWPQQETNPQLHISATSLPPLSISENRRNKKRDITRGWPRDPAQPLERVISAESTMDSVTLARRLANQGQVRAALDHLDKAIDADPLAADLYHARALIAMEVGKSAEAIDNLKRVIYLKPDFILAYYLLGVIRSAQNMEKEAARHFETTSELLESLRGDEIIPGSDGMTAAYLLQSTRAYLRKGRQ